MQAALRQILAGGMPDSPVTFVAPTFPGVLAILTGTDAVSVLHLRSQHKEILREYLECKNMERALL